MNVPLGIWISVESETTRVLNTSRRIAKHTERNRRPPRVYDIFGSAGQHAGCKTAGGKGTCETRSRADIGYGGAMQMKRAATPVTIAPDGPTRFNDVDQRHIGEGRAIAVCPDYHKGREEMRMLMIAAAIRVPVSRPLRVNKLRRDV